MFIELTDRKNNRKFFINTERIEIVADDDDCQIWMVDSTNSIDPVESYCEVVSMLESSYCDQPTNPAPDMIKALQFVEEYLDGIADADQPAGCDHPIANEEMRLLVTVRAALEKARQ